MIISSIRVSFETINSLRKESLTFVPETKIDDVNGIEYISRLYCLEQMKEYKTDPCVTPDILPNYLQFLFPAARIEVLSSAGELS